MYFQPAIGGGGLLGWTILQRTEARQREVFEQSPVLARDIDYFRENFKEGMTAEELVNDRRLRAVAIGAFGLSEEIDKKALIQRVLEGGSVDPEALANKLVDPRYKALAEAFGYGDLLGRPELPHGEFVEDIIARFKVREFDRAIGEVDNDMRLALNFRREISDIADPDTEARTAWFRIMGQKPLREVLTMALNVPSEVAQLDVDRQQEVFALQAERFLGTSDPTVFKDPEVVDEVLRRFFLMRQLSNGPNESTPGFAALTALQISGVGGNSAANLLLSQLTL